MVWGVVMLLCPLSCCVGTVEGMLPDFSKDYYSQDIWDNSPLSDFIDDLRYDNEDKPRQCRIDLCPAEVTSDPRKGEFRWPDAQLETRVYLRCPYSVLEPVYAPRDCVFQPDGYIDTARPGLNNSFSDWDLPKIEVCPDPPLAELLKALGAEEDAHAPDTLSMQWYSEAISQLYDTLNSYPEAPWFYEDVLNLAEFMSRAVLVAVPEYTSFSRETIQQALTVIDQLLVVDVERSILDRRDGWHNERLLKALVLLAEMWVPPEGEIYAVLPMNFVRVSAQRMTGVTNHDEHMTTESLRDPVTTTVSVALDPPGEHDEILHTLYVGYPYWMAPEVYRQVIHFQPPKLPPLLIPDTDSNVTIVLPPALPTLEVELVKMRGYIFVSSVLYVSLTKDHHFQPGGLQLWPRVNSRPTVTVSSTYSIYVRLMSPSECSAINLNDFDGAIQNFNASKWIVGGPALERALDQAICSYNNFGIYAVFAHALVSGESILTFPPPPPPPDGGTSFSEFLGFPYNRELYIAGEVLRAVSVACLLITVISYIVFKKARHGTPTLILLNLCVALILFNIVLYIAESIGHSRWGCRMANILRYYLVLVSLAWNVTEAVNLYLMLIKVFKSHISHFVLKAACMAWGVPLVPVIVVLSINHRGFDGVYLDDCSLKCVLKDYIFYYAYLIPVGAMVLVNVVMFALVVHVLRNHGSASPGESRRSVLTQLCGALSMMFLLGIPWVFSAFGAINITGENKSITVISAIFQVITVVFLNLQGTFIFLFHCVRNSDMRRQWHGAFCAWKTEQQTTSGSMPLRPTGTGNGSSDSKNKTQKYTLSNTGDSTSSNREDKLVTHSETDTIEERQQNSCKL